MGGRVSERGPSQAELLVEIAREDYTFHQEMDGTPFALPIGGPRIARRLRGGRGSLRAELAAKFTEENDKPPSSNALGDALGALEGFAMRSEPTETHLRVARIGDRIVIDLGDSSGRCVQVTPLGWSVMEDTAGVVFRRTELTGALPEPQRSPWLPMGGSMYPLWECLNIAKRDMLPVLAWLVASFDPLIPHPILSLSGEQGTGKTTAARRLGSLVDPSPVPVRTAPKDIEQWIVAAAGSHVVWLDNLSGIPEWLSDALCRASTGDGLVRRALFTDGGLAVTSFRRVVGLTAIDAGALRGDLADRLLSAELERIPDSARRRDQEMAAQWDKQHAVIFGTLLDLLQRVMATMPAVELDAMPRMADFALYLAAVDDVVGSDRYGLKVYLDQRTTLAEDVIESDPVAAMIRKWVRGREWSPNKEDGTWRGSAGDLRALLMKDMATTPKGWPSSARSMSARLKKVAPALRHLGVAVEQGQRSNASRSWIISKERVQGEDEQPSQPSHRHETGDDQQERGDGSSDGRDGRASTVTQPSPQPSLLDTDPDQQEHVSGDGGDGGDGRSDIHLNPVCAVCGNRMIITEPGQTTHPNCDPDGADEAPKPGRKRPPDYPNSCVECGGMLDPTAVAAGETIHRGCRY
jgi:hypothetical protein